MISFQFDTLEENVLNIFVICTDRSPNCLDGADEADCDPADRLDESYYILGIIGLIIFLLILALVAVYLWRRCKRQRQLQPENPNAAYY